MPGGPGSYGHGSAFNGQVDAQFSSTINPLNPSTLYTLQEPLYPPRRLLQHVFREGGLDADPEGVIHDVIGLGQVAADALVLVLHVGLTAEVASEEQTGADFFMVVEVTQHVDALDGGFGPYSDREAEPSQI